MSEDPGKPCWGEVSVIDEIDYGDDWGWVHSCQGHLAEYGMGCYDGEYTPQPTTVTSTTHRDAVTDAPNPENKHG